MKSVALTRQEIEIRLERGLVGKVVTFETIRDEKVAGKIQRLSVENFTGELMIIFMMNRERYEVDIRYFAEHITIHDGSTHGGSSGDVRRLLEGD